VLAKFAVLAVFWQTDGMGTPAPPLPAVAGSPPLSRRDERRLATLAEIKTIARRQLAEHGPAGVSLREISREMRMASSALYRYFTSHDELITALCADAYDSVADALAATRDTRPADEYAGRWWAICHAYRRWSLDNQPDFALIFGTPVPGHHAPEAATGPAAGRFATVPLDVYAAAVDAGAADPDRTEVPPALEVGDLLKQLLHIDPGADTPGYPPRLVGIALTAWASILGFLVTEIFGSLPQLVADTDQLFRAHVRTVMAGMGFHPTLIPTGDTDDHR
jgi:AcrR family transcriptional regulator